jgi:hypothetical protein
MTDTGHCIYHGVVYGQYCNQCPTHTRGELIDLDHRVSSLSTAFYLAPTAANSKALHAAQNELSHMKAYRKPQ